MGKVTKQQAKSPAQAGKRSQLAPASRRATPLRPQRLPATRPPRPPRTLPRAALPHADDVANTPAKGSTYEVGSPLGSVRTDATHPLQGSRVSIPNSFGCLAYRAVQDIDIQHRIAARQRTRLDRHPIRLVVELDNSAAGI